MDGRNSSGRRVSLLNDEPAPSPKPTALRLSSYSSSISRTSITKQPRPKARLVHSTSTLPSLSGLRDCEPFVHSRTSSTCSSRNTPSPSSTSPQTPPLYRSNSSDSTDMDDPSPVTPEGPIDTFNLYQTAPDPFGLPPAVKVADSKYPFPQAVSSSPYPAALLPPQTQSSLPYNPMTISGSLGYPPVSQVQDPTLAHVQRHSLRFPDPKAQQQQQQQQQQQLRTTRAVSPPLSETSATAPPRVKKDKYPCPLAKQYSCTDTFTTSGHAARHAKKHTGVRDAECPECGKTFTRKDNMEQHRKTHQNGRNAKNHHTSTRESTGTSEDSKAARRASKSAVKARPKPSPIQAHAAIVDAASSINYDPTLSTSSTASLVTPQQPLPPFLPPTAQDFPSQGTYGYPDPAAAVYPPINPVAIVNPALMPFDASSSGGLNALAKAAFM